MSGKQAWPELVGEPVDEAVAIIQQENPSTKQNLFLSKHLIFSRFKRR